MIQTEERTNHNGVRFSNNRPRFETAEDWLSHYEHATRDGHRPWEPATRDELLLAEEHGILDTHPEWIPCRMGLRLLQLPDSFGRVLEPYGDRFKERFLSSLNTDREFAAAVFNLICGEG